MEGLSNSITHLIEASTVMQERFDWLKSALDESLTREAKHEEEIESLREQVRLLTNFATSLENEIQRLKINSAKYASEFNVIGGGYSMQHSYE